MPLIMYLRQAGLTCTPTFSYPYSVRVSERGRGFKSPARTQILTLAIIGLRQFDHLTGDTLLVKHFHGTSEWLRYNVNFEKLKRGNV